MKRNRKAFFSMRNDSKVDASQLRRPFGLRRDVLDLWALDNGLEPLRGRRNVRLTAAQAAPKPSAPPFGKLFAVIGGWAVEYLENPADYLSLQTVEYTRAACIR